MVLWQEYDAQTGALVRQPLRLDYLPRLSTLYTVLAQERSKDGWTRLTLKDYGGHVIHRAYRED